MKKKNILMTVVAIFGLASISMAQLVPSYVPSSGLVGWWPFNGNANDESGNGNNGTVNGATLTNDRFGNVNKAYNFDGIDDVVILPANLSSYTIEFWFNFSFATIQFSELFFYEDCSVSIAQNGNYIYARKQNQVISSIEISTAPISNNQWNHCVFIYDNTLNTLACVINNLNIYNSSLASGGAPNFINDNQFHIGGRQFNNSNYLNGKIDDIGIWNRALTQQEITDLYNACQFSVYAGLDQTICNGDPVTLSALNSLNYSWDNGVADGVAFNPTATQDYTVSADSAGCLSTDVVTVTVNEHTTATQIETALDSYTWPINSQTYTQSGTYTAVIPNAAGCDSTITLDLSLDFTGLEDSQQDALFSIFPNPAQSIINVNADNKLIGDVYFISDNAGRIVLTGKLNSQNTTIELGNLSGGIYMFRVGDHMKKTFKVLKE
jgi:hypothetical protein